MWPPRGSSLAPIYLGSGLEAAALVLGPDRVGGGEDGGGGRWWRLSACAWETICKRHKVKIALKSSKSEGLLQTHPLGFSIPGGGGWEAGAASHRGLRGHPWQGYHCPASRVTIRSTIGPFNSSEWYSLVPIEARQDTRSEDLVET